MACGTRRPRAPEPSRRAQVAAVNAEVVVSGHRLVLPGPFVVGKDDPRPVGAVHGDLYLGAGCSWLPATAGTRWRQVAREPSRDIHARLLLRDMQGRRVRLILSHLSTRLN